MEAIGNCEHCKAVLIIVFDLMNDDYVPACPMVECPLFDLTQLPPEVAHA